MHFIRPSWLTHAGDRKACEVYSIHVSPDSERLATGGLDGNVRIWSTKAIFNSASPDPLPRQLCSLSHHSGAVLAVRFSGNNRYLASGSDDKIVLVYERDTNATARPTFGGETHTEVWRTHRRLAGHDNDVQDLGWSADSSVLVSVGLDSKVIVWSGSTFERLKKIDVHQSHVKGLTFDPANKYFATASDDRTVKVFKFTSPGSNATAHDQAGNFMLETSITGPFQESPLTTYFRRCSWSPDGAHIAAANAVNGPVSSVAIINRGNWDSEINLIGHEGPVEVCAFAPRMFSREPLDRQGGNPNPVTVIACAGQDKALSIWNTSNPRPLVITQEIATKAISDLAWSPDGRSVFLSSLDGSIVCIVFDDGDLGFVMGVDENEKILQKYGAGRKGATLPEGTDSVRLEELAKAGERKEVEGRMGQLMMDGANGINGGDAVMGGLGGIPGPQWQMQQTVEPVPAEKPAEPEAPKVYKQKVTITKDGKKRIAPLLVSTGGGHRSNLPSAQLLQANQGGSNKNNDPKAILDLSRPYDGLPKGGMAALVIGNKRKALEEEEEQPVTTGNNKRLSVLQAPDHSTSAEAPEFIRPAIISPALATSQVRLAVPKLRTKVQRVIDSTGAPSAAIPPAGQPHTDTTIPPGDTLFEAKNSREPTRLSVSRGGQTLQLDFLSKPVLLLTANNNFFCAACEDGSLHIYTPVGRRLLNPLIIDAQPCFLDSNGWFLLAISAVGTVHVWNLQTLVAQHPPVSLAPVLDIANTLTAGQPTPAHVAIAEAGINSQGSVVVTLTNGDGYLYSSSLHCWQRLSESWFAVASQYWDTTPVTSATGPALSTSSGIISHLERRTTTEVILHNRGKFLQRVVKAALSREGFEGFEAAVSISHLENRMAAAVALQAKEDFKVYLGMYMRRISAEGLKGKVEEVLRMLVGGMKDDDDEEQDGEGGGKAWKGEEGGNEERREGDREVCGLDRRELLRVCVLAAGRQRELQRVVVPYARLLGILDEVGGEGTGKEGEGMDVE